MLLILFWSSPDSDQFMVPFLGHVLFSHASKVMILPLTKKGCWISSTWLESTRLKSTSLPQIRDFHFNLHFTLIHPCYYLYTKNTAARHPILIVSRYIYVVAIVYGCSNIIEIRDKVGCIMSSIYLLWNVKCTTVRYAVWRILGMNAFYIKPTQRNTIHLLVYLKLFMPSVHI